MNRATFYKSLILLFAILTFSACSENDHSSDKKEIVPLPIAVGEIRNQLPEALDNANIWYRLEKDGTLHIYFEDLNRVMAIAENISDKILPSGRSSSFPQRIHECFVRLLDQNNISYEVRMLQGVAWVIWDKKDAEQVEQLKREAYKCK